MYTWKELEPFGYIINTETLKDFRASDGHSPRVGERVSASGFAGSMVDSVTSDPNGSMVIADAGTGIPVAYPAQGSAWTSAIYYRVLIQKI